MPVQTITNGAGRVLSPAWGKWNLVKGLKLPEPHRLRLVVSGMPGKGKTTFLSKTPDAVMIDVEDSGGFVMNSAVHRYTPSTGADCAAFFEFLAAEGLNKSSPFKHVITDTVDKLVQFMMPWLTDEYNRTHKTPVDDVRDAGSGGKGWGYVNDWILSTFQRLYEAGYGWSVGTHLKEIQVSDPSNPGQTKLIRQYAVNEGIRKGLFNDAQYCLQINTGRERIASTKTVGGKTIQTTEPVTVYQADFGQVGGKDNVVSNLVKNRLGEFFGTGALDVTTRGAVAFYDAYSAACQRVKALDSAPLSETNAAPTVGEAVAS